MTILRDRYELREKLGEGGMAEVYRAIQLSLDREVAIKFIRPAMTQDERFSTRFMREARAIARLNHPNILHVHDFDRAEDGRYFMVMERLEGHDLAARIDDLNRRDRAMPLDDAIQIVRSVAAALRYAHQHDIAHRDIKPGNIFLSDDGRVVVMDFGIAKLLSDEGALTTTGTVVGTPHYFAPEQGTGQPVDYRVDIYALGVVFYEMLTGQVPYDADSTLAVLAQHANAPIPDPRAVRPDLPPEVTGIVQRAMAKDPQHRYLNMNALMTDLDALGTRDGETLIVSAASAAAPSRGVTPPAKPPTTLRLFPHRQTGSDARPAWRTRWLWIVGALVVLAVIAGAAFLSISGKGDEDKQAGANLPKLDFAPAAEGEYLVVVADFVGDETAGVDAARRIATQLRSDDMAVTLGDHYRLEQTSQQVNSREQADALAAASGAIVVVWGVQDAAGLEVVVQAHGYPPRTLTELHFLVPAGDNFGALLTDDAPLTASIFTQSLLSQQLLDDDQYLPLMLLSQNQWARLAGHEFGITLGSLREQYVLDLLSGLAEGDYQRVDTAATNALAIAPDDPMMILMRWMANVMYLHRFERAEADAARLQALLPEAGMPYWVYAAMYYIAGDYPKVIAYTDGLQIDKPQAFFVTMFYRDLALLALGDFNMVLNDVNAFETEAPTTPFDVVGILDDFPAMTPMRALVYEINASTTAAQADYELIRTSRILENTSGLFSTMSSFSPPATLLLYGAYVTEINNAKTVAQLAYDYALNNTPDDYLLNWRRGVLAEDEGEYQAAYDYYTRAADNAPVPFPIVSYLKARLIHMHGGALTSPPDACVILARAQTDADTDADFYAPLLESIAALRLDTGCE